ncbi:MAG: hypothetical protein ACKOCD_01460, partial [Nitrospiraceae bacterium]
GASMGLDERPIVILGAGYTGRHLFALATAQGMPTLAGSRSPETHLTSIPISQRLRFDLAQPQTWVNVPDRARIVWCFPAAPVSLVQDFAGHVVPRLDRLVVLGSTSAYDRKGQGDTAPLIDEDAPLDLTLPRVCGEEYLRANCRATILHSAGIYGPGRHPLDWIRRGRVTASPRYVNLIHVLDLAGICLAALERGRAGVAYNVSDGQPRQWAEICRIAQQRWGVTPLDRAPAGRAATGPGKRLSIARLKMELGYAFRHPDLYEALDAIEACHKPEGL